MALRNSLVRCAKLLSRQHACSRPVAGLARIARSGTVLARATAGTRRQLQSSAVLFCAEAAKDETTDGAASSQTESDDPDLDAEGRLPEPELASRAQYYRLLLWHWVREDKFMERRISHITDPAQLVLAVYFFAIHGQKCEPLVKAVEERLISALNAVGKGSSEGLKPEYIGQLTYALGFHNCASEDMWKAVRTALGSVKDSLPSHVRTNASRALMRAGDSEADARALVGL